MIVKSPIYFISDIHLGGNNPQMEKMKEEKLRLFLQEIRESVKKLFLVGDIYDFWYEYKWVVPRQHFWFLVELTKLKEQGVEIIVLPGNHDMWIGSFYISELGIKSYPNGYDLQIDNKKIFVHHGDGLGNHDYGYKRLKKFLRHPLTTAGYRFIHPDCGIPFAHFVSKISEKRTQKKDVIQYEKIFLETALEYLAKGYDGVVFGHYHKPLLNDYNGKQILILGDWIDNFSFGYIENNRLQLGFLK
jgi:UDP-2,3-diacylglucosamine hydrolase